VTMSFGDAITRTITYDGSVAATSTAINSLSMNQTGTGGLTLSIPSGSTKTLTLSGTDPLGSGLFSLQLGTSSGGKATIQQDGGTFIVANGNMFGVSIGTAAGSTGTYNLTNGKLDTTGASAEQIGNSGSGIFTQSGGLHLSTGTMLAVLP